MGKRRDITNKRFGKLVAVKFSHMERRYSQWECLCDCGEKTIVSLQNLHTGNTQSCGCLKDFAGDKNPAYKHGMKGTKFYGLYASLLARCKNHPDYKGRGIKCEWKSFEEFKDDMYESYLIHLKEHGHKNTSIDRVDNDGDYSKANCRWATAKQQARNRRSNHLIEYNGVTKTMTEWAEEYNIKFHTLKDRINRYKWSVHKALTTLVKK